MTPLRARIAERLGQSGPTVSQTVQRMERDGLLHVADDRHIQLTEAGRAKATSVIRKHRLAEVLLTQVIGLPLDLVHDEACRWEHVISDEVATRLDAILHNPSVSPYGNPIRQRASWGHNSPPNPSCSRWHTSCPRKARATSPSRASPKPSRRCPPS
ncbi:metal-dependent transcriptional regulator [Propioniciclava flava]